MFHVETFLKHFKLLPHLSNTLEIISKKNKLEHKNNFVR